MLPAAVTYPYENKKAQALHFRTRSQELRSPDRIPPRRRSTVPDLGEGANHHLDQALR